MGLKKQIKILIGLGILVVAFQNCGQGFSSISPGSSGADSSSNIQSPGPDPIANPAAPLQVQALDSSLIRDGFLEVEMRLNKADTDPITIEFLTTPGSATTPEHFVALESQVTIPAGETKAMVKIPVLASGAVALDFNFTIKSTSKGAIGRTTAKLIIPINSATPFLPKVSISQHFLCGLNPQNELKCVGSNYAGQMGNGASVSIQPTPQPVPGLSQIKQVSTGDFHACALNSQGMVSCWGGVLEQYNWGQIGNGSTAGSATPVTLALQGIKQLSSGYAHTCALTAQNRVFCWGRGGLLGNGSFTDSSIPVQVVGLDSVRQISAGSRHSCAITAENNVVCWGGNGSGQLGNNTTVANLVPVKVEGLENVRRVTASSSNTCAVTYSGKAYCWGSNSSGQLGNGTTISSLIPTEVPNLSGVRQIAMTWTSACALTNLNQVYCWGANNFGQLGNDSTTASLTPSLVPGLQNVQELGVGDGENNMYCALTPQGTYCWGNNGYSAPHLKVPTLLQGF